MQHLQDDGSYNQLYPKTDSYSKSETLTNNTSQMFRIDNGTPEDVFKWLRKYNQYWWEKSQFTISHYEEVQTDITENVILIGSSDSVPSAYFVTVSSDIVIDNKGKITPKNGTSVLIDGAPGNAARLKSHVPCYVFQWNYDTGNNTATIYYLPSDSSSRTTVTDTICGNESNNSYGLYFEKEASVKAKIVTTTFVAQKNTGLNLVSSKNKDGYSNDGNISKYVLNKGSSFILDMVDAVSSRNTTVISVYSVSFDENTGSLSLTGEGSYTINANNYTNLNLARGKYITIDSSQNSNAVCSISQINGANLFYIPSSSSASTTTSRDGYFTTTYTHIKIAVQTVWVSEIQLRDGNYTLIGNPFESFEYNSKIQMGSYTGTGTYGINSKSSLTFSFVPKMVQVIEPTLGYSAGGGHRLLYIGQPGDAKGSYIAFSVTNNTFYYYNNDRPSYQCNSANKTYYYIGIGE